MQQDGDQKLAETLRPRSIAGLLRIPFARSGFSPLPARWRKRGEGPPAPFPAPLDDVRVISKEGDVPDLLAMRAVEGTDPDGVSVRDRGLSRHPAEGRERRGFDKGRSR